MRILVANIAAAAEHSAGGQFIRDTLAPLTRRNILMTAPHAEVVMRFASEGRDHPAFASCKYLPQLNDEAIYAALADAQTQGFDGAIIGCFGDPYLDVIRAHLDIPVVGFGESALLMAAMVGSKIGLVASADMLVDKTRAQVEAYGLGRRLAGVVASTETPQQQEMSLVNASHALECFQQQARTLIDRGADVLIPACGLTSPALRLTPGMEQRYPHGLTQVDGVPVIDVMGAAVSMVSALIAMQRVGSGWKARRSIEQLAATRERLHASTASISFWDC